MKASMETWEGAFTISFAFTIYNWGENGVIHT